jgi:hypothetical protein
MGAEYRSKDSIFYIHSLPCYLHMHTSSSDHYVEHEIDGSMSCMSTVSYMVFIVDI